MQAKKKKKKPAAPAASANAQHTKPAEAPKPQQPSKPKSTKKGKGKDEKKDDQDDLDTALAELSQSASKLLAYSGSLYSSMQDTQNSQSWLLPHPRLLEHRLHPFYLSQYQTLMQKQKYTSSL